MELPVNPDPEELSVSAFGGRKLWQYGLIIGGVALCAAFVLLFQETLGQTVCSLIAVLIVIPPGYLGMFTKNGMDFFEYRRAKRQLGAGTYVYMNPPHDTAPENKEQKKKGFAYVVKNIVTGGKYL